MLSAIEFRNEFVGKAIDVDGAAGVQCVDLFKKCCYLAGKSAFALGGTGYAHEIVRRFDALGLGDFFDLVSLSSAQYGDWLVWDTGSAECPDSHVAMFERWDGSRVYVLGQNQFGQRKATEGSISASGIIGVLRLKAWVQVTPTPQPSTSTKYSVGTKVYTKTIASSSDGKGNVYEKDHYAGVIGRVIAGARYPYRIDNDGIAIGWTDDAGIDGCKHIPDDTPASKPSNPTVTLPASASTWRAYPTNVAPVVGNECGFLAPAQYGGLTYDIVDRPQADVVTIDTQAFGRVNIYVGAGTGAIIK